MALVLGSTACALIQFGLPVWLSDRHHPLRPLLEALSWVAGVAGLVVAVAALTVSVRASPQVPDSSGDTVRNVVSGRRIGSVLQAGTISGSVTLNSVGVPWLLWLGLAVVTVVVLGVAVLAVVVVQAPSGDDEPELRAVVSVGPGACEAGWVVPKPPGPVPLTDRQPEGSVQADQGEVEVTLQGSLPAAVVLQSMRAEVVSRRPATSGVLLTTLCEGAVTPRRFGVDLTKGTSAAVGLPGDDGVTKTPAPQFPFHVSESEVEQFLVTPNVSTDEVEWRLRIAWTSGSRRGEIVIDNNGHPFRTTGIASIDTLYCPQPGSVSIHGDQDWAWMPDGEDTPCPQPASASEAGFAGTWKGPGTLTIANDGTAIWITGNGQARFRLLSITDGQATADVVASTTPEIDAGERLTFHQVEDSVHALTQLGADLSWCRAGTKCLN